MTPKDVLLTVLSEADALDVLEHRRSRETKKPFDLYRAKLVAQRLERALDRRAALWEMIHSQSNKESPTHEYVRTVYDYDCGSGAFTRRETGQIAGAEHRQGYLTVSVAGKRYLAHRLAWFYAHGVWPPEQIDHIDRDRRNNRLSNLRLCTNQENCWNADGGRNTSGYRGVHYDRRRRKWVATARLAGKTTYLGQFESPDLAASAYQDAINKHRGHFLGGQNGSERTI